MGLRMYRQVGALRKVLSQQAIGVLVRSTLPRALRIAKIDVDVGRQRKATMSRQFFAPIPGQGLIQLLWKLLRLLNECGDHRPGILACHLGQHHVTRLTLDQGRDVGVVRPGQQIALPMARHRPMPARPVTLQLLSH
jgi:hypothetical protein